MESANKALIELARETIRDRYEPGRHDVGAALRTDAGTTYVGVHLGTSVGRIAVCAEAVVLAVAVMSGDSAIDTIVAVRHDGTVVPPCGMCRELIYDYSPGARVIVADTPAVRLEEISALLPFKGDSLG